MTTRNEKTCFVAARFIITIADEYNNFVSSYLNLQVNCTYAITHA